MEKLVLAYNHPHEGIYLYAPGEQHQDSLFLYFWVYNRVTIRLIEKSKVSHFLSGFENYIDVYLTRTALQRYENWLRHIKSPKCNDFKGVDDGGMRRDSSGRLADANGNTWFGYYDNLYSTGSWRAYTPYD